MKYIPPFHLSRYYETRRSAATRSGYPITFKWICVMGLLSLTGRSFGVNLYARPNTFLQLRTAELLRLTMLFVRKIFLWMTTISHSIVLAIFPESCSASLRVHHSWRALLVVFHVDILLSRKEDYAKKSAHPKSKKLGQGKMTVNSAELCKKESPPQKIRLSCHDEMAVWDGTLAAIVS